MKKTHKILGHIYQNRVIIFTDAFPLDGGQEE